MLGQTRRGKMGKVEVTIATWNRFVPRNLSIHPDLVGAEHVFGFEETEIKIILPSIKHLPTEPNQKGPLSFNGWREQNGKKSPIQYTVNSVDIEVEAKEKILLPCEVLDVSPCAHEIISKEQQEYLNHLVAVYGSTAERAFDLWIKTLRWKCNNSVIGRPEISGCESGWPTYLVAKPQDKRVWIAPQVIVARGLKMVTVEMWADVENSLKHGCTSPVYIDLMMDANEHIKLADLQRATVDIAIACETFLRMILARALPSNLQPAVVTYIDDANIRQVIEKFIPEVLNDTERKNFNRIKSKLHILFDIRNKIVHKADMSDLTKNVCGSFIEIANKLFEIKVPNLSIGSTGVTGAKSGQR